MAALAVDNAFFSLASEMNPGILLHVEQELLKVHAELP